MAWTLSSATCAYVLSHDMCQEEARRRMRGRGQAPSKTGALTPNSMRSGFSSTEPGPQSNRTSTLNSRGATTRHCAGSASGRRSTRSGQIQCSSQGQGCAARVSFQAQTQCAPYAPPQSTEDAPEGRAHRRQAQRARPTAGRSPAAAMPGPAAARPRPTQTPRRPTHVSSSMATPTPWARWPRSISRWHALLQPARA